MMKANLKTLAPVAICLGFLAMPMHAFAGDAFGAMAADLGEATETPYYGIGGGATEKEASDAALGFCKEAGGAACEVQVVYPACGALASNGKVVSWGKDATKEAAEAAALSGCSAGNCTILASDCN